MKSKLELSKTTRSNQTLVVRRGGARIAALATGLFLVFLASGGAAFGGPACSETSRDLRRACQNTANSDYLVALAKCANLSDPAEQEQCQMDGAAALAEARQTCAEQFDARQVVCAKLGEGPYDPVIDPANFVSEVTNPYFPLPIGRSWLYQGQSAEGFVRNIVTVTANTKTILGVQCVEVIDFVYLDGILAEDTADWYAQDKEGNVWYFGENTGELVDGRFVTLDGTFTAGVDGDKAGLIMKAQPQVGDFYRQEFSLANAEDLAEVVATGVTERVRAGVYTNCVVTQETTPLETTLLETKSYAPGVGPILTVNLQTGERLELVRVIDATN
ncbi:MAG: hypothetical protein ABIU29_01020 [Chthoniobacterales bacterium]